MPDFAELEEKAATTGALKHFRALAESAPYPMALIAGNPAKVLFANSTYSHVLGTSADEIVGRPFREILLEKEKGAALIDQSSRSGRPVTFQEKGRTNSPSAVWIYAIWPLSGDVIPSALVVQIITAGFDSPSMAMNEALILGSLRQHQLADDAVSSKVLLESELLEQKQTEQKLNVLKGQLLLRAVGLEALVTERTVELTEINKQLESFVYAVAHDLRAPLRAMQGFSEILLEETSASLSDRTRDCASRINKAAQFMDALLIDLLTFSQMAQRRIQLSPVRLAPVVDAVFGRLGGEFREKDAREEHPGPWPEVLAHEPTLQQVLFNLVSNAIKFTRTGVRPLVRVWAEERSGAVRIWVQDNGIGIADEHQSQIFEPFTRLNGDRYPGTGIGLAIVRQGVVRMGGRVGLESRAGVGSRFWIELKIPPAASGVTASVH